jgi:hypothetical protein
MSFNAPAKAQTAITACCIPRSSAQALHAGILAMWALKTI